LSKAQSFYFSNSIQTSLQRSNLTSEPDLSKDRQTISELTALKHRQHNC